MPDHKILTRARVLSVEDADLLIGEEACIVVDADTGEPVLAYLPFEGDVGALRRAVLDVPMGTLLRSGGVRNASRTFGMAARNVVLRREACKAASLAVDAPVAHAGLLQAALDLDAMMERIAPDQRARDRMTTAEVLDDWRMVENVGWTSGNINMSAALPYHRDRANFATWTAMPVLRKKMGGGFLSVPEYDVVLACRDGWACFFNGNLLVHGVTPMAARGKDAYRYSVVYYALRGMKDCFTVAVEQSKAQARRTVREDGMLEPDAALKVSVPLNARRGNTSAKKGEGHRDPAARRDSVTKAPS